VIRIPFWNASNEELLLPIPKASVTRVPSVSKSIVDFEPSRLALTLISVEQTREGK
jgi:hypothetical protein